MVDKLVNPWGDDPLSYLIDPQTPDSFFTDYYETKELLCRHDDPKRYSALLSIDSIDDLIANSELPSASVQMARSDPQITRDQFTYPNGNIDRGALVRHYQQGATLILPQMHLSNPHLADFCSALESLFSVQVQTNIYLTPPNSQGFRTHYDDHDVFVIQVSGEKRWQLYHTPVSKPYRGEGFKPGKYTTGEVEQEFVLGAGDCIYVPRGMMHDAMTYGDEPSLHITVGLLTRTWADLMLEAMSEVALRHPEFRSALPAGFAQNDFDTANAEQHFKKLVELFSREASLGESMDLFVDSFIRSQGPVVRGGISAGGLVLQADDLFCLRKNAQFRLIVDDEEDAKSDEGETEEIELVCAGGSLFFVKSLQPDVKTCLLGKPFDMSSLQSSNKQATDLIRKLHAFGVIEKLP